jgi:hypothetical protein
VGADLAAIFAAKAAPKKMSMFKLFYSQCLDSYFENATPIGLIFIKISATQHDT